ncbi:MAG: hypothetical protein EOP83_02795 [Verrucomicrobiaceae bacterium]|nr:MAG: hypothetical protein EOP83_02795 [Verrucomicrobiaceae bacterium]
MAKWVTPAETAWQAEESIKVSVVREIIPEVMLDDMARWLSDRERPGLFSVTDHRRSFYDLNRGHRITFNITDPDVALEFRVRWS